MAYNVTVELNKDGSVRTTFPSGIYLTEYDIKAIAQIINTMRQEAEREGSPT